MSSAAYRIDGRERKAQVSYLRVAVNGYTIRDLKGKRRCSNSALPSNLSGDSMAIDEGPDVCTTDMETIPSCGPHVQGPKKALNRQTGGDA